MLRPVLQVLVARPERVEARRANGETGSVFIMAGFAFLICSIILYFNL
jgi:hypothetical protein